MVILYTFLNFAHLWGFGIGGWGMGVAVGFGGGGAGLGYRLAGVAGCGLGGGGVCEAACVTMLSAASMTINSVASGLVLENVSAANSSLLLNAIQNATSALFGFLKTADGFFAALISR